MSTYGIFLLSLSSKQFSYSWFFSLLLALAFKLVRRFVTTYASQFMNRKMALLRHRALIFKERIHTRATGFEYSLC
jgi:hypothetical protein